MIVHSQIVFTDPNDSGPRGYLVRPHDDESYPGIVLIQEWWGIEPHILELAQRLASEGYVVIVPDLYHGQIATEPDDARKLIMMLRGNVERALREVELAAEYLRKNARVAPKKLGIMGFCVGGFITFKMACRYPHFGASSPWYGGGIDPATEDLSQINAPMLLVYGELDGGIPLAQVQAIESALASAGKKAEVRVYAGAGHAFLNPSHGAYHDTSATDAWARALKLFKENLV
jgi:carboxymethylenebutenolidase